MTVVTYPSRKAWLEARKGRVGASDVACMATGKFGGIHGWWGRQTGRLPPVEETDLMRMGTEFEAGILRMFARRTGLMLVGPKPHETRWHPERGDHFATPDAWAFCADGPGPTPFTVKVPVEAKLAIHNGDDESQAWWGPGDATADGAPLAERLPAYPFVQSQWQQYVTGADFGWVTACVPMSGEPIRWYRVARNDGVIAQLVGLADHALDCYRRGRPPHVDGSDECRALLNMGAKRDEGLAEDWRGAPMSAHLDRRQELAAEAKRIKADVARMDNTTLEALGDAKRAFGDNWKITWCSNGALRHTKVKR